MHTHITTGLNVTQSDPDYYSIELPPGRTCNIAVNFSHANADIDVLVFASCSIFSLSVASSLSNTSNEFVSWTNTGAVSREYYVRIFTNQTGVCGFYSMLAQIPLCPFDDRYEPANDSCNVIGSPPPLLSPGTHNALVSKLPDIDYFRVYVPEGATADVTAWFSTGGASGNIGLEVLTSCGGFPVTISQSFTDNEDVRWTNTTGVDRNYYLRVNHHGIVSVNSCAEYALTIDVNCTDDDIDEDNDNCAGALTVGPGSRPNRIVRLLDEDWYQITVPNSASLRAGVNFSHADADVDLALFSDCSSLSLDSSTSVSDNEEVFWTNNSGAVAQIFVRTYVFPFSLGLCAEYDLNLAIEGGSTSNIVASCFGDGSGTPCPCNNNSATGHLGGCAHQNGLGAILFTTGSPSASNGGGPEFRLTSGPANTFGILVSGDNALPQIGSCIGCGLTAFDGLRCVGGAFLRHGSRAINASGNSSSGWGAPSNPTIGIAQSSGFVDGQTRHFQAFFRTALDQTCGTGQNSTNGVSVTFGP